ncbi:MAG TPA: hypothetical protein VLD59_08245 [Steroidobacteraceae bacterium]|nr:hypothetical protein [Steroidobacteraceae bacterium]
MSTTTYTDPAIVNIPLSTRGNIDAQIYAYKAKVAKEETIRDDRFGVPHLHKGGYIRVFANLSQAENAANRTGGEAYQSARSMRFLVRFQPSQGPA